MKMRLIGILLCAVMLMAYGCGGSSDADKKGIHGSWTISIEDTLNATPELKAQSDANPAAKEMLKAMLGDFKIIIDTDKSTLSGRMAGTDLPEQKFTIAKEEGDMVTITADDGTAMDLRVVDANTLEIKDPSQGMLLIFKKQ